MGNCLHSGPIGEPGGGFVYCGILRDRKKWALEKELRSLWELCEGNLEGMLLFLGTLKDM
jgi:hypothetical protein